jgi:hypothetical protein
MEDTSIIINENNDKTIVINNINKYSFQIINNNLYLKCLSEYLSEVDIYRHDLKKSEILEAKLNGELIRSPSYYKILKMIWKHTPVNVILQHTIFNFKLSIDSIKGDDTYIWNEDINLAFQTRTFNHVFKEIVNMCKINKFTIELKINLKNNNIILYKY